MLIGSVVIITNFWRPKMAQSWRDLAYLFSSEWRRRSYVQSGSCCGTLGDLGGAGSVKINLTFPTLSRLRSIGLAQLKTASRPMSRAIIYLPKHITAPSELPILYFSRNSHLCQLLVDVAYLIYLRVSWYKKTIQSDMQVLIQLISIFNISKYVYFDIVLLNQNQKG